MDRRSRTSRSVVRTSAKAGGALGASPRKLWEGRRASSSRPPYPTRDREAASVAGETAAVLQIAGLRESPRSRTIEASTREIKSAQTEVVGRRQAKFDCGSAPLIFQAMTTSERPNEKCGV